MAIILFFGIYWLWKGANMQKKKIYIVEKSIRCLFFISDEKIIIKKMNLKKNITLCVFEKIGEAYFFQQCRFCHIAHQTHWNMLVNVLFFFPTFMKNAFLTICWFSDDNTHMLSNKVFIRPGWIQGLIYKHLCNSLGNSLSDPLWNRNVLMIEDGACIHKINYFTIFGRF